MKTKQKRSEAGRSGKQNWGENHARDALTNARVGVVEAMGGGGGKGSSENSGHHLLIHECVYKR